MTAPIVSWGGIAWNVVRSGQAIAERTVSRRRSQALMKDVTPSASSLSQTAIRSIPSASNACQVAAAAAMLGVIVLSKKAPDPEDAA